MEQLTLQELNAEERELYLQLKDVQQKRKQVLVDLDAQIEAEAEVERQRITKQAQELKARNVLGVTLEKLRSSSSGAGLRVARVQNEVYQWLQRALPHSNEEQFLVLCSALVERFAASGTYIKEVINKLKEGTECSYFEQSADDKSVVVVLTARFAEASSERLSEYLTAFAVEWSKLEEQK